MKYRRKPRPRRRRWKPAKGMGVLRRDLAAGHRIFIGAYGYVHNLDRTDGPLGLGYDLKTVRRLIRLGEARLELFRSREFVRPADNPPLAG